MKRKHKNLMFVFLGIGLLAGILIGMVIQQMIFTASAVEFGESLEGTNFNIDINLNETKLVEAFKDQIFPLLNESTNNTKENETKTNR